MAANIVVGFAAENLLRRKTPSRCLFSAGALDPHTARSAAKTAGQPPSSQPWAVPPQQPYRTPILDISTGPSVCITASAAAARAPCVNEAAASGPGSTSSASRCPFPSGLQELRRDQVDRQAVIRDRSRGPIEPATPAIQSRHLPPVPSIRIRHVCLRPPWRPKARGYQCDGNSEISTSKGERVEGLQRPGM